MKNPHLKTARFILFWSLFTFVFLNFSSNSYAWSGYDFNNKVDIEIDQGNLVREGLLIQFYDSKTDSYHGGKILLMESDSGGTMLRIQDLELNIIRTFIMEN